MPISTPAVTSPRFRCHVPSYPCQHSEWTVSSGLQDGTHLGLSSKSLSSNETKANTVLSCHTRFKERSWDTGQWPHLSACVGGRVALCQDEARRAPQEAAVEAGSEIHFEGKSRISKMSSIFSFSLGWMLLQIYQNLMYYHKWNYTYFKVVCF